MMAIGVHDDIAVVLVTLGMAALLLIIMSRSKLIEHSAEAVLRDRGDEISPESVRRTKGNMVSLLKFVGLPICAVGFVISVTNLVVGH